MIGLHTSPSSRTEGLTLPLRMEEGQEINLEGR